MPHVGKTQTGNNFVKFLLEVPRPKQKDGTIGTDRIKCGAWGTVCKTAQYLEQGDYIEITGTLSTTNYQKNGQWVNDWEVAVRTLEIKVKSNGINQRQPANYQQQPTPNPVPVPMSPPPQIPMPTTPPPADDQMVPFDIYGYGGY